MRLTVRRAAPAGPGATTLSGREEPPRWRGRWPLYLLGVGIAGWGLVGLLSNASRTDPLNWAIFFVGSILGHDALLAPIVLLAAAVGVRRIPATYRGVIQAGAVISGAVTLLAMPVVLGLGRRADVPSQLPLPYVRNLLIVLGGIWLGVAALGLRNRRWTHRTASGEE